MKSLEYRYLTIVNGGGKQQKVSVIVPIFNVISCLYRCLDSIVKQTFQDFELILVDDGSFDGSSEICDEYAIKDSRIRVFHIKNGGASAARKFGVMQAKYEWVMFVDADDTISEDCIEKLYLHKDKADIIVGTLRLINRKNSRTFIHQVEGILNQEKYIDALLLSKTSIGPVAKLIKRNIFSMSQWNDDCDIKNNEDLMMLIMLALKAKNIFIDNDIVCYNYIFRQGSAVANVSPLEVWLKLFSIIENLLDIHYASKDFPLSFYLYELHRLYDCVILKGNIVNLNSERLRKLLSVCASVNLNNNDKKLYKILSNTRLQHVVYIESKLLILFKKQLKRIIGYETFSFGRKLFKKCRTG